MEPSNADFTLADLSPLSVDTQSLCPELIAPARAISLKQILPSTPLENASDPQVETKRTMVQSIFLWMAQEMRADIPMLKDFLTRASMEEKNRLIKTARANVKHIQKLLVQDTTGELALARFFVQGAVDGAAMVASVSMGANEPKLPGSDEVLTLEQFVNAIQKICRSDLASNSIVGSADPE